MAVGLTVQIDVDWGREQGDGTECNQCQCDCWLDQFRLVVLINGVSSESEIVLCRSCYEAIESDCDCEGDGESDDLFSDRGNQEDSFSDSEED